MAKNELKSLILARLIFFVIVIVVVVVVVVVVVAAAVVVVFNAVVVVVGCFEVSVLLGLVDGSEVVGLGVGGIDELEVNVTKRQAAIPRTPRSIRAREVRRRIWIRLNLRLRL